MFVLGDDDGEDAGGSCGAGVGGVLGDCAFVCDHGVDVVVEGGREGEKSDIEARGEVEEGE